MPRGYRTQPKEKNLRARTLPILLIAVSVIIVAVTALELTNTTHLLHKRGAVTSTIPASKSTGSDSVDSSKPGEQPTPTTNDTNQPPTNDKSTAPPTSGAELVVPSGNFISNHHPSLSGGSTTTAEESICTTTPGAYCTITFKKDGVTKTLESLQTDSSGTVIWHWDVKNAGFVPGTWTVTATTTLNGQTKSANDLQSLEVQP